MGQVTFPAKHVTSLAFGGADHRTVFATVITDEGKSKIYTLQSPVAGATLNRGRVEKVSVRR
jgi:sugar lactone lactonase YvrE